MSRASPSPTKLHLDYFFSHLLQNEKWKQEKSHRRRCWPRKKIMTTDPLETLDCILNLQVKSQKISQFHILPTKKSIVLFSRMTQDDKVDDKNLTNCGYGGAWDVGMEFKSMKIPVSFTQLYCLMNVNSLWKLSTSILAHFLEKLMLAFIHQLWARRDKMLIKFYKKWTPKDTNYNSPKTLISSTQLMTCGISFPLASIPHMHSHTRVSSLDQI